MTLQFYRGRAGTGKSTAIMEDVRKQLLNDPLGATIMILVPDQMTFSVEQMLLKKLVVGSMRAKVVSFSRLALYVKREVGGLTRPHLNKAGVQMQLHRILLKEQEELTVYKKVIDKEGLLEKLQELFAEYKRYCIASTDLQSLVAGINNPLLKAKLQDTAHIYNEYENWLGDRYVDTEDDFRFLLENIKKSQILKSAELYIDGFHGFTKLEMSVVQACIEHFAKATIALTMDDPRLANAKYLFRMPVNIYNDLKIWGKDRQIEMVDDRVFNNCRRFQDNISLRYLEENLFAANPKPYADIPNCEIIVASGRRTEIRAIAEQIINLARSGIRYKDIVILFRDSSEYIHLLKTVFASYEIPLFIDEQVKMNNHPLIEFIRYIIAAVFTNYKEEHVFGAAKTDLFFATFPYCKRERDLLAILENYVLERGLYGDAWGKKWDFKEDSLARDLENIKRQIFKPLLLFAQKVKIATTVTEYVDALEQFLKLVDIENKVTKVVKYYEENDEILLATHYVQAWTELNIILGQMKILRGDEKISFLVWQKMLEKGLDTLRFSLPPPVIDQVVASQLDVARPEQFAYTFVIGLNDGILPKYISDTGLFTEQERGKLHELGVILSPAASLQLNDEDFLAYTCLTSSDKKVFCSYSISDFEGNGLYESIYVKKLKQLFPNCKTTVVSDDFFDLADVEEQKKMIVHTDAVIYPLIKQIMRLNNNENIDLVWVDVYNKLLENRAKKEKLSYVLKSLFQKNDSENLPAELVNLLYGDRINGSVSRIELFNSCPFAHFIKYGLTLKERKIFTISPTLSGNFLHESLKEVTNLLNDRAKTFADLTTTEIKQLVSLASEKVSPTLNHFILGASARANFLTTQYKHILQKTIEVMKWQYTNSKFSPWGFEVPFGTKNASIPAYNISLANNKRISLAGRCDRIDWWLDDSERRGGYRIIDYKSSFRKIEPIEVYNGISLQLFTYLSVVREHMNKVAGYPLTPAGVLYHTFQNPFLENEETLGNDDEQSRLFLKKFRLSGLLSANFNVLKSMDNNLKPGASSTIVPVEMKKDGELGARSSVLTEEQINSVIEHIDNLYNQSGEAILAGETAISPYQIATKKACDSCSYKAICQIDSKNNNAEFRTFQNVNWTDF